MPVSRFLRQICRALERGTSSLELALVLPLFLVLIFGAMDLGQAVVLFSGAGHAAREGARLAVVTKQPGQSLTTAQTDEIRSATQAAAAPYSSAVTVSVTPAVDAAGDEYVSVVVSGSYQPAAGRLLGITTVPVQASSRMYLP
jgi:Flp pilus assembly protein TadG